GDNFSNSRDRRDNTSDCGTHYIVASLTIISPEPRFAPPDTEQIRDKILIVMLNHGNPKGITRSYDPLVHFANHKEKKMERALDSVFLQRHVYCDERKHNFRVTNTHYF